MSDESLLVDLSRAPKTALRKEFVKEVEGVKRRVYTNAKPKSLYGNEISGEMLAGLAEAYVEAFNDSGAPVISSAWDRVVERQCEVRTGLFRSVPFAMVVL